MLLVCRHLCLVATGYPVLGCAAAMLQSLQSHATLAFNHTALPCPYFALESPVAHAWCGYCVNTRISRSPKHHTLQHSMHPAATHAGAVKCLQSCLKQKEVMLCGPMESGKTTLFHALQGHSLPCGTVTSMVASEAACTIPVCRLNHPCAQACCACG